jgi:hypothetical protein
LYKVDVDAFNQLLYADYLRGSHATGVASVRGKRVEVLKKAWDPLSLMQTKAYDQIVSPTADVLIGHNRHGTMGDNGNHANAHPFVFENVVGAHNGTLDRSCLRGLHGNLIYDTDSEALYSEINQNGIDAAFSKIEGAWALTYVDRKDNTLNMVRNNQRPLCFAYKKGRSVIYWASEVQLLWWIVGRNKIELEDDTVYALPEDTLFTWKIGREMAAPEQRELKSSYQPPWKNEALYWDKEACDWVPKPVGGQSNVSPPFSGSPVSQLIKEVENSLDEKIVKGMFPGTKTTTTSSDTVVKGVVGKGVANEQPTFRMPYKDGQGQILGKRRFDEIMEKNCCVYCGNDTVVWGRPAIFLKSQGALGVPDFLCTECCTDPEKVELAKAF